MEIIDGINRPTRMKRSNLRRSEACRSGYASAGDCGAHRRFDLAGWRARYTSDDRLLIEVFVDINLIYLYTGTAPCGEKGLAFYRCKW